MRFVLLLTLASLVMLLHGGQIEASERTTLLRVALTLVPGCLIRELALATPIPAGEPMGTGPGRAPRPDDGSRLRVNCSRGSGDFAVTAEALGASPTPVAVNAAARVVTGGLVDETMSDSHTRHRPVQHEGVDDDAVRLTILW